MPNPTLAQKARLSERQTRKVLAKLEAVGEIRRVQSNGGRNRRNHYFINLSENPEIKTLKKEQGKNNPVFGDTKTLSPVIESQHAAWTGKDEMLRYFRPSTLFAKKHSKTIGRPRKDGPRATATSRRGSLSAKAIRSPWRTVASRP